MTCKERFLRISWIVGLVAVTGALVAFGAVIFAIVTTYSVLGSSGQIAFASVSIALFMVSIKLLAWANRQITGLFNGMGNPKKKRKQKPKNLEF